MMGSGVRVPPSALRRSPVFVGLFAARAPTPDRDAHGASTVGRDAVMPHAGTGLHAARLRALIVVLWRAGLRIHEALALGEADLDPHRHRPRPPPADGPLATTLRI